MEIERAVLPCSMVNAGLEAPMRDYNWSVFYLTGIFCFFPFRTKMVFRTVFANHSDRPCSIRIGMLYADAKG